MRSRDLIQSLVALMVVVVVVGSETHNGGYDDEFYYGVLPESFSWGVSTSAYQVEGAWNEDGKVESIWDRFCHEGGHIYMNESADITCDTYHKWAGDIAILHDLGVDHYRLSLSWSRLIDPSTGAVNPQGVAYYRTLLAALKVVGIQPLVTLYHWDLPQFLQEQGGWINDTIVDYFTTYADVAFSNFGDLVHYWTTFNEPRMTTWLGYGLGIHAPGIQQPLTLPYLAAHNIIKSHAHAYHLYDTKYRSQFNGVVSITINSNFFLPKDATNASHVAAAERAQEFQLGWYAHPIYVDGDYPPVMKEYVQRLSTGTSRLPVFTEDEKSFINGTFDYFCFNHYSTQMCEPSDPAHQASVLPGYSRDQDLKISSLPAWSGNGTQGDYVPFGFRGLLNYIRVNYNNPPVFITENGLWSKNVTLRDDFRVRYIRGYVDEMIKAVNLDKCNVRGYTLWSVMDNFEWQDAFTEKYGIYSVDFNDPQRPRTPKDSAAVYKQIIADRGFPKPN